MLMRLHMLWDGIELPFLIYFLNRLFITFTMPNKSHFKTKNEAKNSSVDIYYSSNFQLSCFNSTSLQHNVQSNKKWTINFRFCSSKYFRYLFDFVSSTVLFVPCLRRCSLLLMSSRWSFTLNYEILEREKNHCEKSCFRSERSEFYWKFWRPINKKKLFRVKSRRAVLRQSIYKWKWKIINFLLRCLLCEKLRVRRNQIRGKWIGKAIKKSGWCFIRISEGKTLRFSVQSSIPYQKKLLIKDDVFASLDLNRFCEREIDESWSKGDSMQISLNFNQNFNASPPWVGNISHLEMNLMRIHLFSSRCHLFRINLRANRNINQKEMFASQRLFSRES